MVLTAGDLILPGEILIGDYNVEIARWRDRRWSPTIPPLYAVLTDHRLILQPHSRRNLEPAIIPISYIEKFTSFQSEYRHGVVLSLITGHTISLFIPNHHRAEILRNINTLMIPAQQGKKHNFRLNVDALQRLIDYIAAL
jgi:hypothetical protein